MTFTALNGHDSHATAAIEKFLRSKVERHMLRLRQPFIGQLVATYATAITSLTQPYATEC